LAEKAELWSIVDTRWDHHNLSAVAISCFSQLLLSDSNSDNTSRPFYWHAFLCRFIIVASLSCCYVVMCSSFKFPPTAVDEEASEEFRTRESQVHCKHFFCLRVLLFSV